MKPLHWWIAAGAAAVGVTVVLSRRLSLSQFLSIFPGSDAAYVGPLNAAMAEAEISTPLRRAAFLAQLGHESGDFAYWEEIWGPTAAQARYEPPSTLATRLGNVSPGDGYLYRGRGPIQLTGRANYQAAGDALGLDLVSDPDQVASPKVGFRVAAWFWKSHSLNALADAGDIDGITRVINGGTNGRADRLARYTAALAALQTGKAA